MSLEDDQFFSMSYNMKNSHLQQWKESGKKVIGYYCTYIPEELLHAAGFLPFRIRSTGNEDTDLGDVYMVRFTCSFVRMTLDLALKGGFDFLDGLVMSNCCDHARRMMELFDMKVFTRKEFPTKPPVFYTVIPHVITESGYSYYLEQVKKFKAELETKYSLDAINDDQLRESIQIYNRNRVLMRKILNLRELSRPKLTGSEAIMLSLANSSVRKDFANQQLERLLPVLQKRDISNQNQKRIMLVGSVVDNISFTKIIENAGANIVADLLCFGTRNIIDDISDESSESPLEQISKRVYYKMSCPRMMDDHIRRLNYIKTKINEANAQGVILQRINNCDLHGCESMNLEHELRDLDIPVFNIDRENFQKDYNRLQTRIEAFLEMI